LQFQEVVTRPGVVACGDGNTRRSGLMVPERELREITARGFLETDEEILDGYSLTIMALEIKIHAGAELIRAQDGVDHAHHFRAFLVDGGRVEVVDLAIAARA